jgi:hypothetical protein
MVVGSIAAAIAAQFPGVRLRTGWVAVVTGLATVGMLDAVACAIFTRFAVGTGVLPSGTRLDLNLGIWVAIVGLALVAASALLPRAAESQN